MNRVVLNNAARRPKMSRGVVVAGCVRRGVGRRREMREARRKAKAAAQAGGGSCQSVF